MGCRRDHMEVHGMFGSRVEVGVGNENGCGSEGVNGSEAGNAVVVGDDGESWYGVCLSMLSMLDCCEMMHSCGDSRIFRRKHLLESGVVVENYSPAWIVVTWYSLGNLHLRRVEA